MSEMLSVRQWQDLFRSGAFQDRSRETQIRAGWYDWFCSDTALAGRLQRIGRVVMGITEPAILDNYYVWFKNNCPLDGPLYDDVRFEPLEGDRCGRYFVVSQDCPYEKQKWTLYTERSGFETPEFSCDKGILPGHQHITAFHPSDKIFCRLHNSFSFEIVFLLFFLNGLLIAVVNSNRRHRTTETDLPCVLFVIVDLLDEAAG